MTYSRIAPKLVTLTTGVVLLTTVIASHADEAADIAKLARQGQPAQALERANLWLAKNPKDAQVRFQKGLILAEQGRTSDAIGVFVALTQDFPELPEPHNNLAVLYASQGQYDKSRRELELAIQTHPSYATAHENLGDIYAQLARQAYDKALNLDKSKTSAQTKLALIKTLPIGAIGRPVPNVVTERVAVAPMPTPPAPVAVKPAPVPVPVATPMVAPKPTVPPPKVEAPKPIEPPKPATKPEPVASKPTDNKPPVAVAKVEKVAPKEDNGADKTAVLQAVQGWAKAWSSKNVNAYLGYYGRDFKAPGGNRKDWENTRRDRIERPKKIAVDVLKPVVKVQGERAEVRFRQRYESSNLSATTQKTLVLSKTGNRWHIVEESAGN